ncbi:MAG: hypothetical protein LCI02_22595 [Proteobacteria bacterium]|nr:hypothetical protein [Pseudomonadota bacterium]
MTDASGPVPGLDIRSHDAAGWLELARGQFFRGEGGADSDMARYGRAAAAAAQASGDVESEALAQFYIWHRAIVTATASDGERLLDAAVQQCRKLGVPRGLKLLRIARLGWLFAACRFVELDQLATRLLSDSDDLHPIERTQAMQYLAHTHLDLGRYDDFFALAEQSLTLADQTDNRYARAAVRINLAAALCEIALDPEAALALLEPVRELMLLDPIAPAWIVGLQNRVFALDMLGRHEEAYQAWETDMARPGAQALASRMPLLAALALLCVGRFDEAERALGGEPQDSNTRLRLQRLRNYRVYRLRALCGQQRWVEARDYARDCLDTADVMHLTPLHEMRLLDGLREACAALGDMPGALDAAIAARKACLPAVKRSSRARYLVEHLRAGRPGAETLRPIDLQRIEAMERAAESRYHHDIGQIAELKRQAQAAADADAGAAAKVPPFLAHVVHELRNPIGGVMGMAELLMRSPLDAKQRRFVEILRGSADTLLLLVNDVLDLAKLEVGRFQFQPTPVALEPWLRAAVEPYIVQAQLKSLALDWTLAPTLPAQLVFDELRLRQVLANLLSNAVKFTRTGRIDVAVGGAPGATPEHWRLRVEVRDTGRGIAPDAQARLFQEFVQADAGIGKAFGGTGLGLALCKQLVERQGGRIGVDSVPDQGSTFWFELELPVHPPASGADPQHSDQQLPAA